MSSLLAEQLSLSRRGRRVLQAVDLIVEPGEVVALVGPNGAGKSTLLRCLAGELKAEGGCCRVDGTDTRQAGAGWLARHRAVLPQDCSTGFPLAVADVVALGRAPWRRHATPQDNRLAVAGAAAVAGVSTLMRRDF